MYELKFKKAKMSQICYKEIKRRKKRTKDTTGRWTQSQVPWSAHLGHWQLKSEVHDVFNSQSTTAHIIIAV